MIRDEGPANARIVLIGEAGGKQEARTERPFQGAAGWLLNRWLRTVGIQREAIYITNVVPWQPERNDITTLTPGELAGCIDALHERIAGLAGPVVLVPTGNTALQALTGKRGITKLRGSIYEYVTRRGHWCKVIPTIHPAAVLRQQTWERRCLRDWVRIRDDALVPELRLPVRDRVIHPTLDELTAFHADLHRDDVLAIDIETPRELTWEAVGVTKTGTQQWKKRRGAPRIKCLAVAKEPGFALAVPLTVGAWGTPERLAEAWTVVRAILEHPCDKALQNGLFDAWYLAQDHGIELVHYRWDTRWMHQLIDPLDDHDLAYLASVDTRQPYWKDEAKDPDEVMKYENDFDALLTYNSLDAAVTRELVDVYAPRMGRFYQRHVVDLLGPLLRMMRHGVAMDDRGRRLAAAREIVRCVEIQDRLAALAGEPLHGKTDLSTTRVKRYLYTTLGLQPQRSRQTGQLTTNEVTVRRLMLKYPTVLGRDHEVDKPGRLILDHRRAQKLVSTVKESVVDGDGRVRCQYGFTVTGRLTSSKNPRRTGQNLQNVDRALRYLYRPDPGCVFLEVDLSQAESRVVYTLSGDPKLIHYAQQPPWLHDDHCRTGSIVFQVPMDAVTKEQRYFAKHVRHAAHYGMRGLKMAEGLLKEGIVRSPEECEAWIGRLLETDAGILTWQRSVRQQVIANQALLSTWGRVFDVSQERISEDLYRQCYAWQPQSEVGDLTNQWGLVPLDRWILEQGARSRINLQTHDSITVSVVPEEAWDVAEVLRTNLEQPRCYRGIALTIPLEVKMGRTWAMDRGWAQWPAREVFEAALRDMIEGRHEP